MSMPRGDGRGRSSVPAVLPDADRLPTLRTSRLSLRWPEPADAEQLFEVFSDPEVMRFWSHVPFRSLDDAVAYIERIHQAFRARTLFQWAIERSADRRVIGTCTLSHLDATNQRAELGF